MGNRRYDPYRLLSEVYDEGWSSYSEYIYQLIRTLEEESGRVFQRICDAACGTGLLLHSLSCDPWERSLRGFDISKGMLDRAVRRLPSAYLVEGDLRRGIPLDGPFDLITCVYDSLNYLLHGQEILRFFSDALGKTGSDAVLLLDVNTRVLYNRRNGETAPRLIDGIPFRQRLTYDPGPPERGFTEFTFPAGVETHVQRPWETDDIEDMLERAGWTVADTLDVIDESDNLPSGKVVIIAVS